MAPMRQCTLIVLDSVGIGFADDAAAFGDAGSDTLGHIAESVGPLDLVNLQAFGLGNIARPTPIRGCGPVEHPAGGYGRLSETAPGKDTATGHWEMMGLVMDKPFETFPDGFSNRFIADFCAATRTAGVLGNCAASGTEIIERLGREHAATGLPIVYTSADPVLQIAAHEEVVPLGTLYAWCEAAYPLALAAGMSRVIARPFVGTWPAYTRTYNRRDYALAPPRPTFLDVLAAAGVRTHGIGKIASIFAERGIASSVLTHGNDDGIDQTVEAMRRAEAPFVFTNLIDFDMHYGHRRDPAGYAACLRAFDRRLPELLGALRDGDLLLLTADHGNDPTYRGTDHTRERVPLLAFVAGQRGGVDLGTRTTFADVGRTVLDFLGVEAPSGSLGSSFWPELRGA
jgi:phosphopentomutase